MPCRLEACDNSRLETRATSEASVPKPATLLDKVNDKVSDEVMRIAGGGRFWYGFDCGWFLCYGAGYFTREAQRLRSALNRLLSQKTNGVAAAQIHDSR